MKKIINEPSDIVNQMLKGITLSNPEVELVSQSVIKKKKIDKSKVQLVSGGGSGHEPAHAGFVGEGMLSAAVCGEVFTSPTPDQILEAIKSVNNNQGVLLVVKNYTGDVLNFEIARDLAQMEGIAVENVIVNDDVAVEDSTWTTGRRGISGTIFVHKIAGAAAQAGKSLAEVKSIAQKVISNVRSFGISLNQIIVPATAKPSFTLAENEIEFGLGIHGEPGVKREVIKPAKELVIEILDNILKDLDYSNSEVALMVNGLGGTPEMELLIANREAHHYLKSKGIKIHSSHVGNFMTSLEMQGMSISLLKLDAELKTYLDTETQVRAWK